MELRLRREIEPRRGTFSQFRLNVRRTLGCRVTGGPCITVKSVPYSETLVYLAISAILANTLIQN